jgi:FdhD protein
MDNTGSFEAIHYDQAKPGQRAVTRTVVHEFPLVINVNSSADYILMRTPGNDRELVVGFLLTEGLINSVDDIQMLGECADVPHRVAVRVTTPQAEALRNLTVNSSCGLCGRTDVEALIRDLKRVTGDISVTPDVLYAVPDRVREAQILFRATGGTHAAALFDAAGRIQVVREDIGRHNALDKVIGHALLNGIQTARVGVFLSGRTSLEMILKAARAQMPLVAAVSAPTAMAIEAARRAGITMCGFVRGAEITVYTHEQRVR